ncbi:MAG: Hpt domain-containing protein [Saprospiraceae bacterium]|nr:Hpt domain-containing protein [Saprospiraceae bacterium]
MSTATPFQYINLDYLDTMTAGDVETMQQMLEMLIEEIPTEIEKMINSAASVDWEEVFQISHKLKTTLAFIGNESMISLNKTIEHCTRHNVDLNEVPAMVAQLFELSQPVMGELNSI